jgi:hypothetical protein
VLHLFSHQPKVEHDEDSSYDSDNEIVNTPTTHQNVSRNVSETLAQELLEDFSSVSRFFFLFHSVIINSNTGSQILKLLLFLYVLYYIFFLLFSLRFDDFLNEQQPSYRQYLEFALKLGYSERLVQLALGRLGGNPTNNELLAELIKLGSQPGSSKFRK